LTQYAFIKITQINKYNPYLIILTKTLYLFQKQYERQLAEVLFYFIKYIFDNSHYQSHQDFIVIPSVICRLVVIF